MCQDVANGFEGGDGWVGDARAGQMREALDELWFLAELEAWRDGGSCSGRR